MQEHEDLSEQAFEALDEVLNNNSVVLDLEILPSALCPPGQDPILRDGLSVGISKKYLVVAYKPAVTRLFHTSNHKLKSRLSDTDALRASGIVLLLCPEHLTAANLRKRHISNLLKSSAVLPNVARGELRYLDSLLTSRLVKHAKSPTLWSHRLWLLKNFGPLVYEQRAEDILDSELSVIQQAAEHHPRNYCAFDYLRKLLLEVLPNWPNSAGAEAETITRHLAHSVVPVIQRYCYQHPSDVSAWSALTFLLKGAKEDTLVVMVVNETLALIRKFNWSGEAVWTFVRSALTNDMGCHRVELIAKLQSWLDEIELGNSGHAISSDTGEASHGGSADLARVEATRLAHALRGTVQWIQSRI